VQHQPVLVEQRQDIIEGYVLRVVEEVGLREGGLRDTRAGIFAAEGMQDIGHRELAGKEVHSRRVMKEGARADRGNDAIAAPHVYLPATPISYGKPT
jgi:hypothetical protein